MKLITALFNLFCLMTFGAQIPLLIDQDTRAPLGASNPPAWKVWLNLNTANLGTAAYSNATAFVLANDSRLTDARAPLAHTQNYTTIMSAPWLTVEADPIWSGVSNTVVYTNDVRLTDARTPTAHTQDYSTITSAPWLTVEADPIWSGVSNTVVYTNDVRLTDSRAPLAHNQAWNTVTNTPTTISGYGITDANVHDSVTLGTTNGLSLSNQQISLALGTSATLPAAGNDARFTDARTPLTHNQPASTITNLGTAALAATGDFAPASEVTTRGNADQSLTNRIGTEETTRGNADTALTNLIGAIHGPVTLGTTNGLSLSGQALSLTLGTTATLPAAGNDARFTDSRAPTTHNQPASTVTNLGTAAMSSSNDFALASHTTLYATTSGSTTNVVGTQTNSTTGNAATATLAVAVSGTLTNSISGNAATSTLASNAMVASNYIAKGTGTGVTQSVIYENGGSVTMTGNLTVNSTNTGLYIASTNTTSAVFQTAWDEGGYGSARRIVLKGKSYLPSIQAEYVAGGWLPVSLALNPDGGSVTAPSFLQSGYGVLDSRLTNGLLTAIKVFVDKNGVTNTVTIQNGLISAWTP